MKLTPISIAKHAAHLTVSACTNYAITQIIKTNTDIDTDTIPVNVTTALAGEMVASKTDPYTDALVERAAAGIKNRKQQKEATA